MKREKKLNFISHLSFSRKTSYVIIEKTKMGQEVGKQSRIKLQGADK